MNSQLQRFREKHEFCDIFFRVNGTDFDLHRLVLATRMEEFIKAHSSTGRNMRDSGNSADERILFDRLPGGNETFALVVDFCYGIETFKITLESAASLYYVSDFFQMSGPGNLIERVSKFLHGKVYGNDESCLLNAIKVYQIAVELERENELANVLSRKCLERIAKSMSEDDQVYLQRILDLGSDHVFRDLITVASEMDISESVVTNFIANMIITISASNPNTSAATGGSNSGSTPSASPAAVGGGAGLSPSSPASPSLLSLSSGGGAAASSPPPSASTSTPPRSPASPRSPDVSQPALSDASDAFDPTLAALVKELLEERLNLGLVKDKYIMPLLSLPSDLFVSAAQSESAIPSTRWGGRKAMLWRLLDAKSKAGDGNFEDVSVELAQGLAHLWLRVSDEETLPSSSLTAGCDTELAALQTHETWVAIVKLLSRKLGSAQQSPSTSLGTATGTTGFGVYGTRANPSVRRHSASSWATYRR